MFIHQKLTFGSPYFGTKGVLLPQIFACGTEWPRLANAHDIGAGIPKKFLRMKIGPKLILYIRANNFGVSANNPHETFPHEVPRGRYGNLGTNFWETHPLKSYGPKTSKIRRDFGRLRSRIYVNG